MDKNKNLGLTKATNLLNLYSGVDSNKLRKKSKARNSSGINKQDLHILKNSKSKILFIIYLL